MRPTLKRALQLAGMAVVALVVRPTQTYTPPAYPQYGATGYGATGIHWHFYEGLPHADQPDPEILDFWDWYVEALGERYISWYCGRTVDSYRDLTGVCGFDACDVDWVLWDEYQTTPTEYVAMIDAGHNYLWNGGAATSSTVPAANGTLVYRAVWEDNQTPPGAPDATKSDEITIHVVNNTWPDWSEIYAEGCGALSQVYTNEGPPTIWTRTGALDYGKVHVRQGGAMWVSEYRRVESLTVDRYTGESSGSWVDARDEWRWFYYGPTDVYHGDRDPHTFIRTGVGGHYSPHQFNHSGVAPGFMLDPPGDRNATLHGSVCVVKATVSVPDAIPHKAGDNPVNVSWSVTPAETEPYAGYGPYSVCVGVWDPTPYSGGWTLEKWWAVGPNKTGVVQWDGMLDLYYYGELIQGNVGYCAASTVFAGISVSCCNRHLYDGVSWETPVTFEFIAPRIAIVTPSYDGFCVSGSQVTFMATKSAGVTAPLSQVVWLCDGSPATGVGQSFATSFASVGFHTVAASLDDTYGESQMEHSTTQRLSVYACYVSLYADQPGLGGDDDIVEDGDVGHSFFKFYIEPDDAATAKAIVPDDSLRGYLGDRYGFYPDGDVKWPNLSVPGKYENDDSHNWEARHTWAITAGGLNAGLAWLKNQDDNPPTFDLEEFNCTDAAIHAGQAAGINPPDPQGTYWAVLWTFNGSNPGMFGEALRALEEE